MRHQELLFSPSVLGAAIALNDCHHPQKYALGTVDLLSRPPTKTWPQHLGGLAVTLAAILILTPIQVTKRSTFVKGQFSFRSSAAVNRNPAIRWGQRRS